MKTKNVRRALLISLGVLAVYTWSLKPHTAVVRGESMTPTLNSGDLVLVVSKPIVEGDIIVFSYAGESLVKRVEHDLHRGYWVTSDNTNGLTSAEIGIVTRDRVLGVVVTKYAFRGD